jgi:putative membrane protein
MSGNDQAVSQLRIDPRVRMAAERTLLAWLRAGLALMGFGFVVARFGLFLQELAAATQAAPTRHTGLSLWSGMSLVSFGVVLNLLAATRYLQFLRRLERGEPDPSARWPLGFVVALLMAILGIGMTVYLFVVSL